MAIIGVRGMPSQITLQKVIRNLAHVLNFQFEAFGARHKTSTKTYYLKLPEKKDPFETINVINGAKFSYQIEAFMPLTDTNIEIPSKTKKVPSSLRKVLRIPPTFSPKEVLPITHKHIMMEMLSKFTRLYELSKTTNHQLLHTLWQILYRRLEDIQTSTPAKGCFDLSKNYRKKYLHLKDFGLISDVLMKIQKSKGIDFEEINEADFCSYNPEDSDVGDLSILGNDTLETISHQYSDRIISKIMDHIQNFDKDIRPDNQQDLMRAEVRQHIQNMAPCIPTIVKTLIRNKLITKSFSQAFEVVRIYGEPFLPNRDVMKPFLKKTSYTSILRSESIFNLLTIKVPATKFLSLLKCDGTILSGARLVIRPIMSKALITQLKEIREVQPGTGIDIQEYIE